jgi:peroxiredoxin/glyoxylase-like metal-dependent hydrolase (beta-lactamase superfamily II)
MRELANGLWHWTAPHPQWRESEPWDQSVSSYAVDDGVRLLLFDPLGVPSEIEKRAADRDTAIVLTAPWHERDARSLVERLGVPVYTPAPDTAEYLMERFDLTAEQVGDGSPDVAWLVKEGLGEARLYAAGDRLDVGVEALPGEKPNDLVLWVESHDAVVAGDTLVDFGHGLELNPRWLDADMTRATRRGPPSTARPTRGARARRARRPLPAGRARAGARLTAAGTIAGMVAEGQLAPTFTLPSDAGDDVSLESFRGTPVVLYFYPKDDTPGCTAQACGIRDIWKELQGKGAVVLGVSPDSPRKHAKFREKYGLPFTLLSDEEHEVAERYGTWVEKSMYGKTYLGMERSTFVIDADGNVAKVLRKVKPAEHADDVLAALP